MTTKLSSRDQLDIAINGSKQFHAKAASAKEEVQPDAVNDGHREMAIQLKGLAHLFDKTAEYVESGYPAKAAVAHIAGESGVESDYVQKLGSYLDDLGDLVLRDLVLDTFNQKVQEKTAQAKPAPSSERINTAMRRLAQLSEKAKE